MNPQALAALSPSDSSHCDLPVSTAAPSVRTQNLSVAYSGRAALADVSLDLKAGSVTAIVGPSGCGKSTYLHCLNRLTDLVPGCNVEGKIYIGDTAVHAPRCDVLELRRKVGLIFQKPNPFPLSIRENLQFPLREHGVRDRSEREHRAMVALLQVGLWKEVEERLHHDARTLSGGQQQRLCIARALALEPGVLLFDEPCSALDPISTGVIEELLATLRGRYTTIIVTHNLAQARRVAEDIAVFWSQEGGGELIEFGRREQVFGAPQHPMTAAYVRGERG